MARTLEYLAEIVERGLDLLMEDLRKKRFAVGRKRRAKKTKRQDGNSPAAGRRQEPPAAEAPQLLGPEALQPDSRAATIPATEEVTRRSRYIPADVRRTVFERDSGRCTYVDERGQRCPETRRLELDHADGFARGAPHTVDAIRLRCRPHNGWEAERMYGRAFMEEKRLARVSAPARVDSTSLEEDSKEAKERAA